MNEATSAEQLARDALHSDGKGKNLQALAELSDTANAAQQGEHIRGIVATTLAHLSSDASTVAHGLAAEWRTWALSLADGNSPA